MRFSVLQMAAVGLAALVVGLVLGVAVGRSLQPFGASDVLAFQNAQFRLVDDGSTLDPVSVVDLESNLSTGRLVRLIDVRKSDEFAASHIPHSDSIPLDTLQSQAANIPRDCAIVVYSNGDIRGEQAARVLLERGLTNVRYLDGGISAWKEAGLATVR